MASKLEPEAPAITNLIPRGERLNIDVGIEGCGLAQGQISASGNREAIDPAVLPLGEEGAGPRSGHGGRQGTVAQFTGEGIHLIGLVGALPGWLPQPWAVSL